MEKVSESLVKEVTEGAEVCVAKRRKKNQGRGTVAGTEGLIGQGWKENRQIGNAGG